MPTLYLTLCKSCEEQGARARLVVGIQEQERGGQLSVAHGDGVYISSQSK